MIVQSCDEMMKSTRGDEKRKEREMSPTFIGLGSQNHHLLVDTRARPTFTIDTTIDLIETSTEYWPARWKRLETAAYAMSDETLHLPAINDWVADLSAPNAILSTS